jgi:hypothetical protein
MNRSLHTASLAFPSSIRQLMVPISQDAPVVATSYQIEGLLGLLLQFTGRSRTRIEASLVGQQATLDPIVRRADQHLSGPRGSRAAEEDRRSERRRGAVAGLSAWAQKTCCSTTIRNSHHRQHTKGAIC